MLCWCTLYNYICTYVYVYGNIMKIYLYTYCVKSKILYKYYEIIKVYMFCITIYTYILYIISYCCKYLLYIY